MTSRRGFLTGLSGFIACSPAIVRASSLMPVKALQGPELAWNEAGIDYAIIPSVISVAHLRRAQKILNRNFGLMLEDPLPHFYGPWAERAPFL
jgi:hypothetical protein